MAEKKREPFGRRVYNAYRALRGEPWPQVFQFANPPLVVEKRPDIKTLFVGIKVHKLDAERMGPDRLREFVTDNLSKKLARTLTAEGTFETAQEDGEAWDQYTQYTGRLQVVMPEKKEENHERRQP